MTDIPANDAPVTSRFFQLIPAEDYALITKRGESVYVERVVAFGLTDAGVDHQNPFRSQAGRIVPIISRVERVAGNEVSILAEGKGVLVHISSFGSDQAKITALKSGKPLARLAHA